MILIRQIYVIPTLEHDVAVYLAGLFDGEGAFMIHASKENGVIVKYNARIRIAMSDKRTIEWVANKLNRPFGIHGLSRKASLNCKKIFRVSLENGESIISLIQQLLPFLITKKEVAQELLSFCLSRKGIRSTYGKGRGYKQEDVDNYLKLKELNRFGIKSPIVELVEVI